MNAPTPHYFDPENAQELLQYAALAYSPDLSDPSDLSNLSDPATDTHAIVRGTATDIFVAFRGTADLRNWLTDLDCKRLPLLWSAGRVHRGFNAALNAVAEALDAAISPGSRRRIWVTGHSLGGALAMLFALRLEVRRHMPVAGVYTFGQPRVGNFAFAAAYDELLKARTFRVVHADDIVPRVPWLLGFYHHAGHEVLVETSPGDLQFQIDLSWWRKLPLDIAALSHELSRGRLALLADHHLKRYVDVLARPVTSEIHSLT